jgi:seryl-tRNA(Sec) selenium transferase
MIREGLFVSESTRTRQGYRTERFYRHTFTLLLAIGASVLVTAALFVTLKIWESGQIEEQSRLASQESQLHQDEDRLRPTQARIEALAALRNRIEKRTPAARMLAAVEAALARCPNVCLHQVQLESTSDDKNPADIDRWSLLVQAVTRIPDRQVISDFREALGRELGQASVVISEQPNFMLAQPQFSLQVQYPR